MSEMLFGIAQVSLARSGPGEDDASFPPVLADVCHARAAQFIRRKIPPIDPGHLGGGGSLTSPPVGSAFSRSLARAECSDRDGLRGSVLCFWSYFT